MTDLRKAAEMALEALDSYPLPFQVPAKEALRQALAQPEQEPFIYVREVSEELFGGYEHCSEADVGAFPVYTAPMLYTPKPKRKWVGLTDDDKQEAFYETQEDSGGFWEFADYLEAKLKEKNT